MNFDNIPTDDHQPSSEEIMEIHKDMHMSGRARRIDETKEDYNKEREESWQKIVDDQIRKDQTDVEQVRRGIDAESGQLDIEKQSVESYKELANVQLAEEKLKALLDNYKDGTSLSGAAKNIIYEMLTRRSDFVKNTNGAGIDAAQLMDNFQPQVEWYRNTRAAIEKEVAASGNLKWDSNPGWFGINTRPEVGKREAINIKVYTTIPAGEYSYIQHIPKLAEELRKLALESDDIIQVKVPESYSGFIAHNDSIVVHFKNQKNGQRILEILNNWMQASSIHEQPREMGRTKIAADSKNASFSELVSQNIASWLEQYAGKYDKAVLASEAIRHAIEQSQNSPL